MATFNGIDYAIIILLFLSVAFGIARGFIKEIISILAWVAAFMVATLYCVKLAAIFSGVPEAVANPIDAVTTASIIVSYLALFIGILVCGSILKLLAHYLVKSTGLGFMNRFLGAVFGLGRGCVIILITLFFLSFTALTTHSLWKDSKLIAVLHPGLKWMNHVVQPYVAQIEAKMKKTAKSLNQEELSDVIKSKAVHPAASQTPVVTPAPAAAPMTSVPPVVTTPSVPAPQPAPIKTPVMAPPTPAKAAVPASPSKP